MLQPERQRESEWERLQSLSEQTQFGTVQDSSAAPIDPERIHDASGLKILIVVLVVVAAVAIAWILQNRRAPGRVESPPSQGVTVTTGQGVTVTTEPQHAAKKASPAYKPARKPTEKHPQ